MGDDKPKDQPQKDTDKLEGQKPPEPQKPPVNPEKQVVAATRMEWRDFMGKEGLDRLKTISDRKKQIDEEQKKLQEDSKSKRGQESWVNNPRSTNMLKDGFARDSINSSVEEKFSQYKQDFDDAGLGDSTNQGILKQVAKDLIFEYYQKNDNDGDKTKEYVKGELLDKLKYIMISLKEVYDSKKHGFNKPAEVMEAFSTFTGTDFMKKEFLQASAFKDFLCLDKSTYETFVTNFGKSLGLKIEKKQLEGEEATLMSKGLEPKELIDQKKITFTKTRFTAPKDGKDLDKVLQAEIPKALPPMDDAKTKQKIVDYLAGEVKKLNPQPDEVFELSPEGQWAKIDIPSENKSKDDAKTDAEQKATEVATTQPADPNKPFDLKDSFKSLGDTLMEFFRWLLGLFGVKMGAGNVEDLIKEWKDATPEEISQTKDFYASGKKYFSKIDNFNAMIKNQDETKRVLAAKKADTLENETWDGWVQRHLSKSERDEITFSTTIQPRNVADKMISENGPGDEPAEQLKQKQEDGQKTDKPAERARIIAGTLASAPYAQDLIKIMDDYAQKNLPPDLLEGYKKGKNKGGGTIENYIELIAENLFRKNPDALEKYKKGEASQLDVMEAVFDEVFRVALANAKTPQEKQKINDLLEKFKATLGKIMTERGKPEGVGSPGGSAQPSKGPRQPSKGPGAAPEDPDVTLRTTSDQPPADPDATVKPATTGFLTPQQTEDLTGALYPGSKAVKPGGAKPSGPSEVTS